MPIISGVARGAWAPDVLPKAPDLFEDGPFTSQIQYVLFILICSPSTRNPPVRDEKQSVLLDYRFPYVFIPLNTALKHSVYVLDI